jgi:hypothetical protein
MFGQNGSDEQVGMPAYGSMQSYGDLQALDFQGKMPFTARGPRKPLNLVTIVTCFCLPFLIFEVVFAAQTFSLHYDSPRDCALLCYVVLAAVFLLGYFAYSAMMRRTVGVQEPEWYVFAFASSALAWLFAFGLGQANFEVNMQPFYDVSNLNVYHSVNPAKVHGQQLMDAGRIMFAPDSHLDVTKAMGFQNQDNYCVAPVTVGPSGPNATKQESYDFWAVGLNCCSGHGADYHCGDYSRLGNGKANSGLRLMREEERPYYRLAVQQAEAAHNIRAMHPVFLYWVEDANTELFTFQDEGFKYFLLGSCCFCCLQLFAVVMAAIIFSRMNF